MSKPEIDIEEIGYFFWIEDKYEFWVGIANGESRDNKLTLWVEKKAAKKLSQEKLKQTTDGFHFIFENKLNLSAITEKKDFQEQEKVVVNWLKQFEVEFEKL